MKTHVLPLDFHLLNANAEAVLVLGGARDLTLEISNTSPTALYLDPRKDEQQQDGHHEDLHHFSLRFRAGVLRDHSRIGVGKADRANWQVDTKKEKEHGIEHGDVLVHLRHKTQTTWAAGETLKLTLEGLHGEPAGGTRATRVELAYQNILNKEAGVLLAGKPRHQQLVLTMPSSQEAPATSLLEAHFVGETGNVVLNDGKSHDYSIDLRLTNTTAQRLYIGKSAAFHVTFADGPPDRPGALATNDLLQTYVLSANLVSDASVATSIPLECKIVNKQPVVWMLLAPENIGEDLWLGPAGYLEIKIGGIVTQHRNGPSNVHVHWVNLSQPDGDMAGEVVVTIQKSPLVVVGGKVGVGAIPTPDGPTFDNATIREALALARKAMRAVANSSIRGQVTFRYWDFNDSYGYFRWPTIDWTSLDVFWPERNRRVGISRRELTQIEWRELMAWLKNYPDPGTPRWQDDLPFFHRSPHELFYLYDPANAFYFDAPASPDGGSAIMQFQDQYANKKAQDRLTVGFPLKPNSSLYAKIDLTGKGDASQPSIFFDDHADPEQNHHDDCVLIARWDDSGVTGGCDFNVGSSDLRSVRLPPPPAPPSP